MSTPVAISARAVCMFAFDFTELDTLDSKAMSDNVGGNIAYSGDPTSADGPEQLKENKDPEQTTPILNTGTGPGPTLMGETGARPLT